ncbi:oxidoreductase [Clostridia bacterium]|nr:oxidoreductase [Clostridia bacterium]
MEQLSAVLVGIGGYALNYVKALLSEEGLRRVRFLGAVDPFPADEGYERLTNADVPVFATLPECYAHHPPDLAIVCSPTPFHAEQAAYCLNHGSHVLLEKPLAPTLEAAQSILAARDAAQRELVIGYQWCFNEAMQNLKSALRSGEYGLPLTLRALVLWPRDETYYHRGVGWAGKRFMPDGHAVFDNVASNATAHYLMNMLWLADYGENGVDIDSISARAARANDIETFDSVCMKIKLTNGATLAFAASHAIARDELQNPVLTYTFERGEARFGELGKTGDLLTITQPDGHTASLGSVSANDVQDKLMKTLDVILGRIPNPCPIELAIGHTKVMHLVEQQLNGKIQQFPPERLRQSDALNPQAGNIPAAKLRWVQGLADTMRTFFETMALPDEL